MSNLSRRDFLKGSLAGAASLAMAGVGLGAVNAKASADGLYTPGTYSATATGMGTVTVTATFDENSIVDVVLDLAEETPAIGQAAHVITGVLYLEEELITLLAVLAHKGGEVLHGRGLYLAVAEQAEHSANGIKDIVTARHLHRCEVTRAFGN